MLLYATINAECDSVIRFGTFKKFEKISDFFHAIGVFTTIFGNFLNLFQKAPFVGLLMSVFGGSV